MTSTGTIAFIPARGGSISIPRKNLVPLDGKPLIQYSIDAAKEARVFDRIIVSTNDGGVKEVAACAGLEIHDRPESFATASSRVVEAVEHASTVMQLSQEHSVCVLQPTSPLRTSRNIIDAIEVHRRHHQRSVVSVVEKKHHPFKTVTIESGEIQWLFGRKNLEASRQTLQQAFRVNGAIYISRLESILRHHSLVPEGAIAFVMNSENSVDVDSYEDLAFAEFLLSRRS
jgi:CMP-N-acetylneuraminic acid synthetase